MKKTNFFRELLDPNSNVSSKRFSGIILLGVFAVASVAAVFVDLDPQALELLKMEGILGASLLGVNAVEKLIPMAVKTK